MQSSEPEMSGDVVFLRFGWVAVKDFRLRRYKKETRSIYYIRIFW